ncbi:MAG: 4'-phosphopantetheinyl transferase superfamily protein [Bacteroidetes bacterium]|nr:4'-phosphopantetheinyl transferase superfamily protein [Bacteroidota bacterium]
MFLLRNAGNRGKLSIWHITEPVDELLKMKNFSEEDLKIVNGFSYEHRKKEWLVSRILLEEITGNKNLKIVYDENNKPFLENSKKNISISHSHNLLALIIDEKETGIDIEQIKPNVLRIKEKFMSDLELKALERGHKEEELTLYWCVKESLYKLYGKKKLTFKENLFVEPFEYLGKGKIMGEIIFGSERKKYILHYEKISADGKEFMLTYVLNE